MQSVGPRRIELLSSPILTACKGSAILDVLADRLWTHKYTLQGYSKLMFVLDLKDFKFLGDSLSCHFKRFKIVTQITNNSSIKQQSDFLPLHFRKKCKIAIFVGVSLILEK